MGKLIFEIREDEKGTMTVIRGKHIKWSNVMGILEKLKVVIIADMLKLTLK